MFNLPSNFVQNVTYAFPEGATWLAELPTTLAEVAGRWSLTLGEAVPNLSFNYVCFVTRADGTPAVLKVGVPCREIRQEMLALQFYNGQGAVRLLEWDAERGWLLLERIYPGTSLIPMTVKEDDTATRILAEMMLDLCVPLPTEHPFQPITEWAAGFNQLRQRYDGKTGPLPESLIARAEALFALPVAQPVLLHGDFHHDNVLKKAEAHEVQSHAPATAQWMMIDPKGMAGARLAEVGPLLYNPLDFIKNHTDLAAVSARRVAILAEVLNEERELIIEWGVALAMLSAWWSIDDSREGWRMMMHVAETLSQLKG